MAARGARAAAGDAGVIGLLERFCCAFSFSMCVEIEWALWEMTVAHSEGCLK